jgi:hypothetical protein
MAMKTPPQRPPDQPLQLTLLGFAEARSKVLDIAAYLDRLERHGERGDVRHEAIRQALAILADGDADKARRVLLRLSDPTADPVTVNPGKSATGVWPGLPRQG